MLDANCRRKHLPILGVHGERTYKFHDNQTMLIKDVKQLKIKPNYTPSSHPCNLFPWMLLVLRRPNVQRDEGGVKEQPGTEVKPGREVSRGSEICF